MASLPAGDRAVIATTIALTALGVQVGSLLLPPLPRLWPQTMPWPSLTHTYTSSDYRHVRGRRPDCCCLYWSFWGAVVLVPQRPLSWCCTGIHPANGARGCLGADRSGRIWLKAGLKPSDGLLQCSVFSEVYPSLLTLVSVLHTC